MAIPGYKDIGKVAGWVKGRSLLITLIFVLPSFASSLPFVNAVDQMLVDMRFQFAARQATGNIAYIAIDKHSLDHVGKWPWPRSVHAELASKLVAAGASDIFFDVDFSALSTPREDAALEQALADAGGGIILPVFEQHAMASDETETVASRPIPALAQNSWPALANVRLDEGGVVRRFEFGRMINGEEVQSAPALLAKSERVSGDFLIDYSIDPTSVPTYSVDEILTGETGAAELKGRSVVVGAFATELNDVFPVPVHAALTGPMIHILAAETLLQQRFLSTFNQLPLELVLAGLIAAAATFLRGRPIFKAVAAAIVFLLFEEGAALLLFEQYGLILHTATPALLILLGLVLFMNDKIGFSAWLTELANAEHRNTRRILKRVISDSADAVVIFDDRMKVVEISHSTAMLLDLPERAASSQMIGDFVPPAVVSAVETLMAELAAAPERVHSRYLEFQATRKGEDRHFEAVITLSPTEHHDGDPSAKAIFVGCMTVRDMTARHLYEQKVRHLSQFDDLTGLLNRRELIERINQMGAPFCVFVLDLHRFAILNSTLGREMGDALLKAAGDRLILKVGGSGLVGRLGGDVFCVAVPASEVGDAGGFATELLDLIDLPFEVDDIKVETAARLGACCHTAGIGDGQAQVQAAELALDEAKKIGGRGWRLHDPKAADKQARSRRLEREMRSGLSEGQFFLLYQPQIDLMSAKVVGAEALIRWEHPLFGTVSPFEFIHVAEANGFICDIGRWVLEEACRTAASWPDDMSVAVNVSAVQFAKTDLLADVKSALAASGLSPSRLHLEITETAFMERTGALVDLLKALRSIGVVIAIDDFGTGYSSLSYISKLPLDKVKIDQSFVRGMAADPSQMAIVQAIRSLAGGLGLKVVCEGIEGDEEWTLLRLLGCEEGQGYYFGKPQSAAALLELVETARWSAAIAS